MQYDDETAAEHEQLLTETRNAMNTDDGEIKSLTPHSLELLDAAIKSGHPDAYFLRGLTYQEEAPGEAVKWYHYAEAQGCKHPDMYYFLGKHYSQRYMDMINARDPALANAYFEKAIGGGCALGYYELSCLVSGEGRCFKTGPTSELYCSNINEVMFQLDCVYQGIMEHTLSRYIPSVVAPNIRDIQPKQHVLEVFCDQFLQKPRDDHANDDAVIALLEYMKQEEQETKGGCDERVINQIIEALCWVSYTPSHKVLGDFADQGEMAMYYCQTLIKRKSPFGYERLGDIYWYGYAGIPKDQKRAIQVWLDAHKERRATSYVYKLLCRAIDLGYYEDHDNQRDIYMGVSESLKYNPRRQDALWWRISWPYWRPTAEDSMTLYQAHLMVAAEAQVKRRLLFECLMLGEEPSDNLDGDGKPKPGEYTRQHGYACKCLKKTLRECALADCQVENYLAPIYPDIRTYYPKWRNDTELVSESDSD